MTLNKGVKTALKVFIGLFAAAVLLFIATVVYFIFFYKSYLDDPVVYAPLLILTLLSTMAITALTRPLSLTICSLLM